MLESDIKKLVMRYKAIAIVLITLLTILTAHWDGVHANSFEFESLVHAHAHSYLIMYIGVSIMPTIHILCQLIEKALLKIIIQTKK